jgi:hypothetical protein
MQILEWAVSLIMLSSAAAITLWMAGAVYYDLCGASKYGWWLGLGWVIGVIAAFSTWQPVWQPFTVLVGVGTLFLCW